MSRVVNSPQQRRPPFDGRRSRLKQNFTAINVDDPFGGDDDRGVPMSPNRGTPPNRASQGNGLRDLIDRQDQLLNHQMRVAGRQDEIASHLANQNNALNEALLKQVLSNKDNMIANLASMQASEWDDQSKDLLAKHIRYIVAFIQRLNTDISGLESELKGRDMAVIGTNAAVNKLEVHHVTMLQDVRSRIVRCEQAISKHTKDIALLLDDIRRVEGQIMIAREKLGEDIHRVEAEFISMNAEHERQTAQLQSELSHQKSNMHQQLGMVEDRMRSMMSGFNEALDSNKADFDHRMEKQEARFKTMIDKATEGWGTLMTEVDKRINSGMSSLSVQINKLDDRAKRDRAKMQEMQHRLENDLMVMVQEHLANNNEEVFKAKDEFRRGFRELQESITNLKGVVDGKRKILAHQVNKEIGAVRRVLEAQDDQGEQGGNTIIVRNRQNDGW